MHFAFFRLDFAFFLAGSRFSPFSCIYLDCFDAECSNLDFSDAECSNLGLSWPNLDFSDAEWPFFAEMSAEENNGETRSESTSIYSTLGDEEIATMAAEQAERKAKPIISTFFRAVYRPRCARMLGDLFFLHVPTLESAKAMNYDNLSAKLNAKRSLDVCSRVLLRVIALLNSRNRNTPVITGSVHTKIFLASYLIVSHPDRVFEAEDDLTRALQETTEPMIDAFEGFMRLSKDGVAWQDVRDAQGRDLSTLLCRYLRSFKAWKTVDERRLLERLKHAITQLEIALAAISGEHAHADVVAQMRIQITRLRDRVVLVAGQAALDEYDRERAQQRADEEARQSQVMEGEFGAAGMTNEQLAHELLIDPEFRLQDTLDEPAADDNRLIHTRIRTSLRAEFWEQLYADLCKPPPIPLTRLFTVLDEVKGSMQIVCKDLPAEDLTRIGNMIDLERTTLEIGNGEIDLGRCENLVASVVDVLVSSNESNQESARAAEMLAAWDKVRADLREASVVGSTEAQQPPPASTPQERMASAVRAAVRFVIDRLYLMRVDTANRKLRAIAPVIATNGIDYERAHFERKLQSGALTLATTDRWIRHTLRGLHALRDETKVSLAGLRAGAAADVQALFRIALVDLVSDYPHWGGIPRTTRASMDEVPAPLKLDLLRIKSLNAHLHTDVMCAIIIDSVGSELRRLGKFDEARMQALARAVLDHPPRPFRGMATINLAVTQLSTDGVVAEAEARAIYNFTKERVVRTDPAYSTMLRKFKARWYDVLFHGVAAADVQYTPIVAATESGGATPWMDRLVETTDRHAGDLRIVYALNRRVHSRTHKDVAVAAVRAVAPVDEPA